MFITFLASAYKMSTERMRCFHSGAIPLIGVMAIPYDCIDKVIGSKPEKTLSLIMTFADVIALPCIPLPIITGAEAHSIVPSNSRIAYRTTIGCINRPDDLALISIALSAFAILERIDSISSEPSGRVHDS